VIDNRPSLRRVLLTRGVLLALTLFAVIGFSVASPYFLTVANLVNLLNDLALAGIVALPATFLMMSGQVDLSVGATAALTGVVLASTAPDVGMVAGIALALGTGLLIGVANGGLVTVGRVNSFAVTVATLALIRGLAYLVPSGLAIVVSGFRAFSGTRPLWGIAVPTLLFAALSVLAGWLSGGGAGRRFRAIGRRTGRHRFDIRADQRWVFVLFVASGLAAAVAGLIRTSQLGTGLPSAAVGLELTVLTAVLLGGGHLAGGRGSIAGTLVALLMLYVLDSGLALTNVSPYASQVLTAALLVIALVIDGPARRMPSAATGSQV
jgi:ribose transport system permease protein